jgi:hypothetical protein
MSGVDAPGAVAQWFADWKPRLRTLAIEATLKLPQEPDLNKAVATLESSTHVASITAWGAGTLEYIVLDVPRQTEVVMWDKEFGTVAELRLLLDECADSFLRSTLR